MEGATLHMPYADLWHAVGNCCRKVWRLEETEEEAALNRRGGIEVGGLSGRSVKGPGGLLLEGDERKEGCGGGSHHGRSGKSGAGFVERLEPPAGCCSRGVYRHVSADASTLSRTGLGLTTLVRCVG